MCTKKIVFTLIMAGLAYCPLSGCGKRGDPEPYCPPMTQADVHKNTYK